MRLQILVPHRMETRREVEPLLDSIAIQQRVDLSEVGVVIAHDGSDAEELPIDDWDLTYPFEVIEVTADRGGVSHARNAALDAATADYVMFCDADDMFCDACGLFLLFREMDLGTSPEDMRRYGLRVPERGFDTLISVFREETKAPDGSWTFINHEHDSTFVHGKVHRRAWLVDNNLRFNDSLTVHEDSYFNILTMCVAKPWRRKYCELPFYLWRWRDASVCRHDPKYILKTYNNMLDSNDALVDELVRRSMSDAAMEYSVMMTFDAYYTMNKEEWRNQENVEYRDAVERRFAEYFRKHRDMWDSMPEQQKMLISQGVRQRSVAEGMLMEALTPNQWLDSLMRG